METFTQIHFTKHLAACNVVDKVSQVWERMDIKLCLLVQQAVVPDRPKGIVGLWSKMQRAGVKVCLRRINPFDYAKVN